MGLPADHDRPYRGAERHGLGCAQHDVIGDPARQAARELGYQNIIITDGMEMGAITQQYSSAEAAVSSIKAGVDIVLGPKNLVEAFDAVMDAVNKGTITEERINQSVRRILKLRQQ